MNNLINKLFYRFAPIPCGKVNITITSHPTNPHVAKVGQNGQITRPKLWEEIKAYESYTPKLIENHNSSEATGYLNQINIWFDFDRHQDDTNGIIIYMYLTNLEGVLKWYSKQNSNCSKILEQVTRTIQTLWTQFSKNEVISVQELQKFKSILNNISQQIKNLNLSTTGIVNPLEQFLPLVPPILSSFLSFFSSGIFFSPLSLCTDTSLVGSSQAIKHLA